MKATVDLSDQLIFEAMKLSNSEDLETILKNALDHYVEVAKLPKCECNVGFDYGQDHFVDPALCAS